MSEISIHELEMEHGELLPEREALGAFPIEDVNNIAIVQTAANVAIAVQGAGEIDQDQDIVQYADAKIDD